MTEFFKYDQGNDCDLELKNITIKIRERGNIYFIKLNDLIIEVHKTDDLIEINVKEKRNAN